MTAVILAAGRGGRLRAVAGERPKCLIRIGDITLLERQIHSLRAAGMDRIVVVTGYRDDRVRAVVGPHVDIVHNGRYASTNSLYSLWLARECLAGGGLILNGDVLFHRRLLIDLLTAHYEDALLVSTPQSPFTDEEMKVRIRRGKVVEITKTLPDAEADAENVGIAKFGADGALALVDDVSRLVATGGAGCWLPAAFATFSRRRPLYAVESRGLPWIEIDFPEDYWRACSEILPAIAASEPPVHAAPIAAVASGRTRHHV
jgi:choline kinase